MIVLVGELSRCRDLARARVDMPMKRNPRQIINPGVLGVSQPGVPFREFRFLPNVCRFGLNRGRHPTMKTMGRHLRPCPMTIAFGFIRTLRRRARKSLRPLRPDPAQRQSPIAPSADRLTEETATVPTFGTSARGTGALVG